MYRQNICPVRTIKGFKAYSAESLEAKLRRVKTNGEAIKDKAPLIYTDRNDGVLPDYDIRTDKYEYLVEGYDKAAKAKRAKLAKKEGGVEGASKSLDAENAKLRAEGAQGGNEGKGSNAGTA